MFQRARRLKPDNARLLSDYAHSYTTKVSARPASPARGSDIDRAVKLSEEAARLSPNEAVVYAQWAIALFLKEDYAGAEKRAQKAIALDARAVDPHFIADLGAKVGQRRGE
jgi:tetratricopeptide (TPR) repeat protein